MHHASGGSRSVLGSFIMLGDRIQSARHGLFISVLASVSGLAASHSHAQTTIEWANPAGGSWFVPGNWSPAVVPNAYSQHAIVGGNTPFAVEVPAGSTITIDGLSLTNPLASMTFGNESGQTLVSLASKGLWNAASLTLHAPAGSGNSTLLEFTQNALLAGPGSIFLDHASNSIIRAAPGANFTLQAPQELFGTGVIQGIINESTISADVSGQTLSVAGVNRDVVQAVGGTLLLNQLDQQGNGIVSIRGATSRLHAQSTIVGGRVEQYDGAIIDGGRFVGVSLWSDIAVGSSSATSASLTLEGAIEHDGMLRMLPLATQNSVSRLILTNAQLNGWGITQSDNGTAGILVNGTSTIGPGQVIRSFGFMRPNVTGARIINYGTIESLSPSTYTAIAGVTNHGLIRTGNGGGIRLQSGNDVLINNGTVICGPLGGFEVYHEIQQTANGVIRADASQINIRSDSAISGGKLESVNGGLFYNWGSGTEYRDITNNATIIGRSMKITGTLRNDGLIRAESDIQTYVDNQPQSVTVSGNGVIRLEKGADFESYPGQTVYHAYPHRLEGVGTIDAGKMFINEGTIAPGSPYGMMVVFNVAQAPLGTVEIELGGPSTSDRDLIQINGQLYLGGTLRVRFLNGYMLEPCESYTFIIGTGNRVNGVFAWHDLPVMPFGKLSIDSTRDSVTIAYRPADVDGSGFVDLDDFGWFIERFESGDDAADFDNSGFVDTDDFTAFAMAFEDGC